MSDKNQNTGGEQQGNQDPKVAELEARIEALEAHISDQQSEIESLREDKTGRSVSVATKKERPELPKDTFTVSKKTYQFAAFAFILDGEKILAKDALKDKALLKQLVESGSSVVKEVN